MFRLKNKTWVLTTSQGEWTLADVVRERKQEHPFYLYDLDDALQRARQMLSSGFHVHYAMKANAHPRLLKEFAALGLGADVVSLGEMQKALSCGFSPEQVIFSGVAKDREELEAALRNRILQINVESFEELKLLREICVETRKTATVAIRVNVRIQAPTHAHVQTANPDSKFGVDLDQISEIAAWLKNKPEVQVKGLAAHIGSQITEISVFEDMARRMGSLYKDLRQAGLPLERLDLGGGLGLDYAASGDKDAEAADLYLKALKSSHGTEARITVEPGRFLVARMGALLAKVIYVKSTSAKDFLILNAGMNCLMRPALYDSFHRIRPLVERADEATYTVVGPICESTDTFAVDRKMSRCERGDWVAIFDAGAYGASMANTYNEHPLPKEWSVLNGQWEVS